MDETPRNTRRECLLGVAGLTLPWMLNPSGVTAAPSEVPPPPKDAAEALRRLKEGNRRFAEGTVRHAHQAAVWRDHLTAGQQPFATILACSDSRVPPELVFDQGFGDLFVIRVAGNLIASDVLGSIQYALMHLRTPLLVIMGHEGCGAVTATLESLSGQGTEPRYINLLIDRIKPGLAGIPENVNGADRVHQAVEANVRWSMRQLIASPEGKQRLEDKTVTLVGAVYELATGTVRFLD
ncbi:MAG: carbonic anhydrase [Planctomycetes bacterium]|nr:carbonic anhydrase [Planctomycetota bacterium]